ncbi:MFS transporter [Pandoraea bronchicola]|uniref:MFS transporter n=2 Tax=Pandoraea bronchicola TaxID=2508287 RepID=A0A5E5C126_9BURK|nr:MFS transporter [Pandoraea bronchicola]
MPVFSPYPSARLVGGSAAAAIGMINSIGQLAGFVSPFFIGWCKDVTQSTNAGMHCVSAALALGAVRALSQSKEQVNRQVLTGWGEGRRGPLSRHRFEANKKAGICQLFCWLLPGGPYRPPGAFD